LIESVGYVLRKLYNRMIELAAGPHAEKVLAVAAFAEASFFPIPPDIMLAPMVLADRSKAWRYAIICSVASVLGGFLGYYIGYSLQDLGLWILHLFGHKEGLEKYREWFSHWGFLFIIGKGFTPIPYKIVTIAAGLAQFSLWQFFLASAITRTARFCLVAYLFRRFGPEISEMIEKRFYLVGTIVVAVIVIGVVAVKLLPH
jgi:membrane protein YqaA with SNARE-associated domain